MLADLGPQDEPPTLRHARAVVETCLARGAALDSYRGAAIAALRSCRPCDHDLPF